MISTATVLTMANVHDGSGPKKPHSSRVAIATTNTASTNQKLALSAGRCIGARERCACATSCTICDSTVSGTNLFRTYHQCPLPFKVAPITLSPAVFSTGIGRRSASTRRRWSGPR
jgi:hypothetical protein